MQLGTRKIKAKHLLGIVGVLLFFAIPVISFVVFAIASPQFVPSGKLMWLTVYGSPVVALLFFVGVLTQTKKQVVYYFKSGSLDGLKALLTVLFAPVFGYFVWNCFASDVVPYFMHQLDNPTQAVKNEVVISVTYGRRRCRNRASLTNDTFLFHREVCNLSLSERAALHNGGAVLLRGTESSYGFTFDSYTVAPK